MPVIYRPAKFLDREKINVFRCMPVVETDTGGTLSGKPIMRHGRDIMVTARQNASLLKRAFRDLSLALEKGQQIRMIVPVNSYALASSQSSSLMVAAFKDLPSEVRQQVIIDVFDFPSPLTLDILDDITVLLMPFFHKLMAEPAPDMDSFEVFANCNYFGVSFDQEARGLKGSEAIDVMTKFWGKAKVRRLKTIIQGVSEAELSEKADRYEAFLQDGPYIGQDTEAPSPFTP